MNQGLQLIHGQDLSKHDTESTLPVNKFRDSPSAAGRVTLRTYNKFHPSRQQAGE